MIFLICFCLGFTIGAQVEIKITAKSDKLFGNITKLLKLSQEIELEFKNTGNHPVEFYLKPRIITASASSIEFKNKYLPNESICLTPQEIKSFNSSDFKRMYGNLLLSDIIGAEDFGLFLPKSNYTFCFEVEDVETRNQIGANFPCFWFETVELDKPIITQPSAGTFLTLSSVIEIKWASGNKIKEECYSLEIINLSDVGESNPEWAFSKFPEETFLLIHSVKGNTFVMDLSQYILEHKKSYAIRVKSIDTLNRYNYNNKGYSDPVFFYF